MRLNNTCSSKLWNYYYLKTLRFVPFECNLASSNGCFLWHPSLLIKSQLNKNVNIIVSCQQTEKNTYLTSITCCVIAVAHWHDTCHFVCIWRWSDRLLAFGAFWSNFPENEYRFIESFLDFEIIQQYKPLILWKYNSKANYRINTIYNHLDRGRFSVGLHWKVFHPNTSCTRRTWSIPDETCALQL